MPPTPEPAPPGGPTGPDTSGSLETGLGFRVGRAHRILRDAWSGRIADLGLTAPQTAMLRAVCEWPGSGVRELARRTGRDPMNVKRLADHLEGLGLVSSRTDPAHRQRRVLHPTDTGRELAAEVARRATRWNRELVEQVGADDVARLFGLLARIESVLDAGRPAPEDGPDGETGP